MIDVCLLGCGGMMAALERTASGSFSLSDACTLEQLGENACKRAQELLNILQFSL